MLCSQRCMNWRAVSVPSKIDTREISSSQRSAASYSTRRPAVLLVDDEPHVCAVFRRVLLPLTSRISTAHTLRAAVREMIAHRFDALLIDLALPDGDGATLIGVADRLQKQARIVVVSGYVPRSVAVNLDRLHIPYLEKTAAPHVLCAALLGGLRLSAAG